MGKAETTQGNVSSDVQADLEGLAGTQLFIRLSRGIGALSLGAVVNIIGQLSVVPVALYIWGETRYGEWIVLTGLVTFLKLTDLGLQTYVVNLFCASYARHDWEEVQRLLHSVLKVQYPLMIGVFTLFGAALLVVPLDRLLGLQTTAGLDLFVVVLLLVMELLIGVPMGVIAGLYRATGRLARAATIGACQQLALLVLTLALVGWRTGFMPLAAARGSIALLVSVWIIHDLRHLYPWLRFWPASGAWREGLRMIGPGLFFLLIPVADYLSNQLTLMVVQKTLTGSEVSRLATHRTVVNLAQMVSGFLMTAVWPELTALHARGQHEHMVWALRSLTKCNVWLVGTVIFGVLPFLPWIYPSWTAGRLTLDEWTLVFLTIRLVIWGMWGPSMTVLMATNRHQRLALVLLSAAGVTSVLAVALVPVMGIGGAALAALAADLCIPAWLIPFIASREIGDSPSQFMAEAAAAVLWGIGIPIGLGLLAWHLFPPSLLRYLLVIPMSAGIAFLLMWWQLAASERQLVISLGQTAFANRKFLYPL